MGKGGRLLVMGDVHGQYSKMQKVLALAHYDPARDQLVLLGDYVDRGPESWRVVEAVLSLVAQGAVALYGNHEDMMLRALFNRNRGSLSTADLDQWYANGGETTIAGYRDDAETLERHLAFFRSLPRWHEERGFLFVHAGIRPAVELARQSLHDLIWIREPYILDYDGPQDVVAGHTPTQYLARYELFPDIADSAKPIVRMHKFFIDTGAAWGGPLTIMDLPTQKYWQA